MTKLNIQKIKKYNKKIKNLLPKFGKSNIIKIVKNLQILVKGDLGSERQIVDFGSR